MGVDKARRTARGDGQVKVDGPWLPIPLRFLQSRACAELSPHAAKLLLDLMSLLKPNGGMNGDLWASADALRVRGWGSDATRSAAMRELQHAHLVSITRRRSGRRCELIALTLWPLACDQAKLDRFRVQHTITDYYGASDEKLAPPTSEAPATWRKARPAPAKKKMRSRSGNESAVVFPLREVKRPTAPRIPPAAGTKRPKPAA